MSLTGEYDIIFNFELNQNKQNRGSTVSGVNLDVKNSMDITISPKEIKLPGNEVFEKYFKNLFSCYQDYVSQWSFLTNFAEKLEVGSFNLQRYQSGQHFQSTHTERTSLDTLHRLFAWMTYLNDVEDGGETYFTHYDMSIKPKKGLTIIWPAEWTHAHFGDIVNTTKYIATGWFHFPPT